MRCIIIEDQLPAQRILKRYISDMNSLELIGVYSDAIEAMRLLKDQQIDLIFLDIHLPKISGIEFLKTLQNPPQVILTTAFQEYAIESYELNVVDYLLKPFSFQRFLKAIAKVNHKSQLETAKDAIPVEGEKNLEELYIKSGYEYIRIKIEDIIYIVTDLDYTEIHLQEKKYLSSESLRHWESLLSKQKYARIHKSYLVNTAKINKVSGNQVFLENDTIVPIGRAYKNDFTDRFIL